MEEKQPKQNIVTDEDSEDFTLPNQQSDEITVEKTRGDFLDFIGNEADKYLTKFRKFYADGRDKFAFTWHWPAFLFTFSWMAYRKLYGWALVVFFLSLVPVLRFLLWPVLGLTGNYLYYKHTKKKILNVKTTQTFSDSTQLSDALHKIGGVNVWAAIVGAVLQIALHVLFRFWHAQ
jgi:hypothetical protein